MIRSARLALAVCALVASTRADAEADRLARAKGYYEAGEGLFKLGRYGEAIREFSAGYALMPEPRFLINIGQSYRELGDRRHAAEMYQRFLDAAPRNDPLRPQVERLFAELHRGTRAAEPTEGEPPAPPSPAPAPPVVQPPPVAAVAAPS